MKRNKDDKSVGHFEDHMRGTSAGRHPYFAVEKQERAQCMHAGCVFPACLPNCERPSDA